MKYKLFCKQRMIYFGQENTQIYKENDFDEFDSLDDVKKLLLYYHKPALSSKQIKELKQKSAYEIAEMFDWSIDIA